MHLFFNTTYLHHVSFALRQTNFLDLCVRNHTHNLAVLFYTQNTMSTNASSTTFSRSQQTNLLDTSQLAINRLLAIGVQLLVLGERLFLGAVPIFFFFLRGTCKFKNFERQKHTTTTTDQFLYRRRKNSVLKCCAQTVVNVRKPVGVSTYPTFN
jgi:hypothetical protein